MDIKSLQCFVAVSSTLNFSRAAESLYLSQPALSLRINALEKELGVNLFHRTHQKVFLTPAGSALLPEAEELLARFEKLPQMAKNGESFVNAKTGYISVGLDSSLPDTMVDVLTRQFIRFYEEYPQVQIDIDSVEYGRFHATLAERKHDLCFVGLQESVRATLRPQFNCIPIAKEKMVLACVDGGDTPPEALLRERELLLLEGDRWNYVILNYLERQHINVRTRSVAAGLALYLNLMRPDTVTYMPISFFHSLKVPRLRYCELDIPDSAVLSCFVWDRMNYNPAVQLLVNCFDALPGESV